MKTLITLTSLSRAGLSFFAACSAATGCLLVPTGTPGTALLAALSVFLLACGASALNQVQEQDIDSLMERTRSRPVASGILTTRSGLVIALTFIVPGLFLIGLKGPVPLFLGIAAILWYNGLYTYLKRRTAFAAIPGAIVGAIPPAVGWTAGGGGLLDLRLLALCAIFFLWQVPHFWLLLLRHGEEYEKAGLPSLTRVMSRLQIARVSFIWILSAAAATLLLPLFGLLSSPLLCWALVLPAVWLAWRGAALIKISPLSSAPALFRTINIYLFILMTLLSFQGIMLRVT